MNQAIKEGVVIIERDADTIGLRINLKGYHLANDFDQHSLYPKSVDDVIKVGQRSIKTLRYCQDNGLDYEEMTQKRYLELPDFSDIKDYPEEVDAQDQS